MLKTIQKYVKTLKKSGVGQEDDHTVGFLLYYLCFLKKLQINTYRSR